MAHFEGRTVDKLPADVGRTRGREVPDPGRQHADTLVPWICASSHVGHVWEEAGPETASPGEGGGLRSPWGRMVVGVHTHDRAEMQKGFSHMTLF